MSFVEQIITILMGVVGVQLFRWLPFWVFPAHRPIPSYIQYLGKSLTRSDVWYVSRILL